MRIMDSKLRFNRVIPRTFVLVVLLTFLMGTWNAWASTQQDDPINCGDFMVMMANYQPENPLFPKNPSQLSKEQLYQQTVQNMDWKGYKVLDGKSYQDPLEANEFVQVSYIFAEGPPGKNLFEQKLFLKKAGVINTADVGLTTAYDGKVYQTHKGGIVVKPVQLATPVYMDDNIKTELLAKATFTFDDKSTLTLAEGSTINITKHIYNPEKDLRQTIVHLSQGTVRFVVTKGKARGSMFKVITPTAIAGVRGTEFVVTVEPNGKTTFLVLEGQIETKAIVANGKALTFLVSAGEIHSVSKNNGKADLVKKTPPGLLKKVRVKTSPPGHTLGNRGFSKKMARNNVQKLALVKKANNSKGMKKANKDKVMKAKVLKTAHKTALFNVKTLDKRFEKIRGEKSSKSISDKSGNSNAKSNAKDNAKSNAKDNAKSNAKASAKEAAKEVAKEKSNNGKAKGKGKGKGKV